MKFIMNIIISTLAVLITQWLLPGVEVSDMKSAVLVAVVLAFMNSVIKPILTILTIPITVFSLGLFLLVINAVIILLTDRLIDGFEVKGFWWALLFSLILSLVSGILNAVAGTNDREEED